MLNFYKNTCLRLAISNKIRPTPIQNKHKNFHGNRSSHGHHTIEV